MKKRISKFWNDTYAVFLWESYTSDNVLCYKVFKAKRNEDRWCHQGKTPQFPHTPEGYKEASKLYEQMCKEMSDWIDQQIAEGEL